MMASLKYTQEGPKSGVIEFKFPREGENLCAQECSSTVWLPDAFLLPSFLLHLLTLTDKTFVEVHAHKVSHSF